MITVVIVDDDPDVRAGWRALLELSGGFEIVAEAADGLSGLDAVQRLRPAVTLLDHRLPRADALDVLTRYAEHTRTIVLTSDGNAEVVELALARGAYGFITTEESSPGELARAVTAVADGRAWLSPGAASFAVQGLRSRAAAESSARIRFGLTRREQELVELLALGATNAEIATRLALSEKTVKNHLNHIYAKLGTSSRVEAIARWHDTPG